jgi:hypothetical protein
MDHKYINDFFCLAELKRMLHPLFFHVKIRMKIKIKHGFICVVTHFWTPRVGDGAYLFWTECKSLAHVSWKIDKNRE